MKNISSSFALLPLVLGQLFGGSVEQPSLTEKVALYSKPSVVRIISACSGTYTVRGNKYYTEVGGIGTGFFLNSDGYILTNAHVVRASQGGKSGCEKDLFDELLTNDFQPALDSAETDLVKDRLPDFEYFHHVLLSNSKQNSAEAFEFDIKEMGAAEAGTGKDIAVIKIQLAKTPVLKIAESDRVDLGDRVTVIGYPASARLDEFGDGALVQAGVFSGTISKTNATLKDNTQVFELDVSVGYGSSGSPVLNSQGNVIGMVTFDKDQAMNQVLQGSANPLALRTDGLFEYIRQAGILNETSELDVLYRDGLDFLWNGNFQSSKTKFESVQDLFPQHSEIEPLLKNVRNSIASQEGQERNYLPLVGGILGVGFLLGVAYWFINKSSPELASSGPSTPPRIDIEKQPRILPPEPAGMTIASQGKDKLIASETFVDVSPYIEIRNQSGQKYYLNLEQETHTIGRDADWSDLKNIGDEGWGVISRRQATFCKEEGTYRIYDGDKDNSRASSNGIFFKEKRISGKGYRLQNGDSLIVGGDPRTQVFLSYYDPRPE